MAGSFGYPQSVTLRGAKGLLTRCFGKLSMTIWEQARKIIERPCVSW